MKTKKLTTLALLTAIALALYAVELQLPGPVPIPGVKLGLANIITVYAVYEFSGRETFALVLARVLLGAFFGGGLSALLFSLAGALLCLAGMIPLRRVIPARQMWLSSVFGAVLHNLGQTLAAFFFLKTAAVFAYLPILLFSGCIAGLFTGLCAGFVRGRIRAAQGKGF